VYNALILLKLLYGSEIWTLEKKIKSDWHESKWNFSEEQLETTFLTTKEWRNFGGVESRNSWGENKKIQIKLATKSKKNEGKHDDKNNAELQTKWTKTTWKTFQKNIRRGRNSPL